MLTGTEHSDESESRKRDAAGLEKRQKTETEAALKAAEDKAKADAVEPMMPLPQIAATKEELQLKKDEAVKEECMLPRR